jgi:hypothetical protein
VWEEKAAELAGDYDFAADGAKFDRSQAYEQARGRARWYWSRRSLKTVTQRPEPARSSQYGWIGNLAEEG